MYKEIEVEIFGHDGKISPMSVPLSNISYYRPWVETSSEVGVGKDKLMTMIYLQGSIKSLKVNCSYEEFKSRIKELQN